MKGLSNTSTLHIITFSKIILRYFGRHHHILNFIYTCLYKKTYIQPCLSHLACLSSINFDWKSLYKIWVLRYLRNSDILYLWTATTTVGKPVDL